MFPKTWLRIGIGVLTVVVADAPAAPMGSEVTYQGRLEDGGSPVTGQVDLRFTLYDAPAAGNVVGATVIFDGQGGNDLPVVVTDGLFTAAPDFGANVFDGTALWLQIEVRNPHDPADLAPYTPLDPRQPITAAPIALQTKGLFVDETFGNVGIGTSTPMAGLEINRGTTNNVALRVTSSGPGWGSGIRLKNTAAPNGREYGLFSSPDGKWVFDDPTAGAARMVIVPSGNVGIGTSAPSARLDVVGPTELNGDVTINSNLTVDSDALFVNGASGNVGIGTTAPTHKLTVDNLVNEDALRLIGPEQLGAGARLNFGDSDFVYIEEDEDDRLTIFADERTALMGGNVGIGTLNPSARLDVLGTTELNGDVTINSNLTVDTDALFVKGATGNVGIGTTSPSARLHVQSADFVVQVNEGSSTIGSWLKLSNTSAGGNEWALVSTGSENGEGAGRLLIRNQSNFVTGIMVEPDGDVIVPVLEITGGADIAEPFNVRSPETHAELPATEPGMVVCIDPERAGELRLSRTAYDRTVAGVISGAGGVKSGMILRHAETVADGQHPVALTGRVYCWVDADRGGPVEPGDMLTTSGTPGHAMKATDLARAQGAVLGKAMSSLNTGKGLVLVLVSLQ